MIISYPKTSILDIIQDLIDNQITMVQPNEFNMVLKHYNAICDVEGDIVECGCWRGGFSIFLSHLFMDRNIWVADSFEGFQPLEEARHSYSKERHTPEYTMTPRGPLAISLEEVQGHFENYGLANDDRIKFLKGFVKDTLPTSGIEKIALLRVDVDAYSATLETLEELYDKVVPGGYIVFDDSCLYECIDAIRKFTGDRQIPQVIYHPVTDQALGLYDYDPNFGYPPGCYIIKQ